MPWWRQAQADLETAAWNLQGERWYAASTFAQQSAEKALKALWIERGRGEPRRTHDLHFLGQQLQVPDAIQADLNRLTLVFGRARYPELTGFAPIDSIDEGAARLDLDAARRVLAWTEEEMRR